MDQSSRKNTWLMVAFRTVRVILVLSVSMALAYALIALKKTPEKNEIIQTPPAVRIVIAKPVSKTMTIEAMGTVKPRKSVKVATEVPGRIVFLSPAFIEGGQIQKDELLVQIDPESYQLEKSAAQVRIRQSKTDIENFNQEIENLKKDITLSRANLSLVKKELDRISTLTENKYASKNSLDRTEQQFIQAKMQLQKLENRLGLSDTLMETKKAALSMATVDFQKADLALKRTSIKADFNGFILEKMAENGEYVNPGQTLGVIYQKGKLDVDIRIPMEKIRWLNGFSDAARLPLARIRLASDNNRQTKIWKGRVARVMASIDEQTRTLPLTIEIESEDGSEPSVSGLKPGTFVKCDLIGETIDRIFVVPRYLLKQGDILYTVDNGQLKMKKVGVLRKIEDEIYINSGLEAGEKVIVSPLPGAIDGMKLSIIESGQK